MATQQIRLPFGPLHNSNLFSNHWLDHRLPLEPEWTELRPLVVRLLSNLANLWKQQKNRVEHYSEPSLEQAFIQPVLNELGWKLLYQTFLRGRKPDYALFLTEQDLDASLAKNRNDPAFWEYATLVADAKAWSINLDRPAIVNNQREYPPEQIEWYIHHSAKTYGILTNGRLWRLYPRDLSAHQPRFNTYFECDLAALLDRWTSAGGDTKQRNITEDNEMIEDFLRFYLFFSPGGFFSIDTRKSLVQRAIEGSNEYRLGIGEGLKDRVFEALRICTEGFLSHRPNNLDPENHLWLCKEQSLILLYRLLFIMYAEDRELLPFRSNRVYRDNRSLSRLRDQIATRLDNIERGNKQQLSENTSRGLWDDLLSLFDLIDRGSGRYGVPAYNGGLFEPEQNSFLNDNVLPDHYLARVIDQLSRALDSEHPDAGLFRVDYRDLSIQHLGHIYEGLLELQPHWATEPMAVIRKKNHQRTHEQVIPVSQKIPKGAEYTGIRYETSEVFLVTDKGERRATGSYYTPDYIVGHIVSQTLGPLCKEINDKLEEDIKQTESKRKNARGRNRQLLDEKLQNLRKDFDNRVLHLKVLDPAMGSGHFLLRACQYLAEEIATNPNTSNPEADQLLADESLLTFWKRCVVEHCLYGVDINPLAVELAKVALWLETAAIGQPLTFLDHHLRCGNSLVGGWIANLGSLPSIESLPLFEQQASSILPGVLEGLKAIADKSSDTRDDVKLKDKIYHQTIDRVREPFVSAADLWCATFFLDKSNQITPDQYLQVLQTLGSPPRYRKLLNAQWFKTAIDIAHRPDVSCFHWELEFPDIFFDLNGRRPEAGFDVIIGNPPWVDIKGMDPELVDFYFASYCTTQNRMNIYATFLHKAIELIRPKGLLGFITPNSYLTQSSYKKLREFILHYSSPVNIVRMPDAVFPDVKAESAVGVFVKSKSEKCYLLVYPPEAHISSISEDDAIIVKTVNPRLWEKSDDFIFNIFISNDKQNILKKLSSGKLPLADSCDFCLGLTPYDKHKGHTREQIENKVFHAHSKEDDFFKPLLSGAGITRYAVEWDGAQWIRYGDWLGAPRQPRFFRNPRILVRQIISGDPLRIYCGYTEQELYNTQIAFNILLKQGVSISLKYILGILNSKLITFYHRSCFLDQSKKIFQKILIQDARKFPIYMPDFGNPVDRAKHDKMVKLVDRMLDLHKKLAKAKVPDEKTKLHRQITTTDKQIDNLVYELYNLTPDEIAIVEKSS